MPIVRNYSTRNSYYKVGGRPFLSTFSGGTESFGSSSVNEFWTSAFQQYNLNPYFIPNFDNVPNYPNDFFTTFPVADGVFSWETAWPAPDSPAGTNVSSSIDTQAIEEAHTAGKVYMMRMYPFVPACSLSNQSNLLTNIAWSSLQYKNLPGQFYYRIGEAVFGQRIAQISSAQPDYVELITWNDSGESHYAGDIWPEAIAGTNIPNYAIYDHSGFQKVITPVIQALKAGATDTSLIDAGENPTGAVWYHPILTSNPCSNGRRAGIEGAEDAVDYAIFLPQGAEGMIEIYSGGSRIGSMQAGGGLNTGKALGLGVGSVEVYVLDREGNVLVRVNGSTPVLGEDDPLCNFNFVVQGF